MADLADAEVALVAAVMGAVYPSGAGGLSITGAPVRVYRGWPMSAPLAQDLATQVANISVFSVPGATRNTTRWLQAQSFTASRPSVSVTVMGNTVSFAGSAVAGEIAGVLVNNAPYVYVASPGDSAAVICAQLAQSIRAVQTCWLSGTSLSVPGVSRLQARTVAIGSSLTEWARQVQEFRIGIWCAHPAIRDQIASALGSALAAASFLTLADGTAGRLRYRATSVIDDDQNGQLYRRDLHYDVEYGTTQAASVPALLFGNTIFDGATNYG